MTNNIGRKWSSGGMEGVHFFCPGCNSVHGVVTNPRRWTWNGDLVRLTFSPSILVTYDGRDAGEDDAPPTRCHSFVTDGRIQFLSDCTHVLAGQTVDLPPWPYSKED